MSQEDPLSLPPSPPSPMPVVPVPYQPTYTQTSPYNYGYSGRPGLVTTMGVFCIIVAGISIIFGGFLGLINFNLASASKMKALRAGVATAPVQPKVGPAELLPPDGMPMADRQVVVGALAALRPLSEAQQMQLDELLAIYGQKLFPSTPSMPIDAGSIQAAVSKNGPVGDGDDKGDSFVVGDGRIEVWDARAVFVPSDGSDTTVAVAPDLPPVSNRSTAPALSDDQIRSVLRNVSKSAGTRLAKPQVKSLVETLRRPGEQLITPTTDGSDPACEIQTATSSPEGMLTVTTSSGANTSTLSMDSAGNITGSFTGPTPPPLTFMPKIDRNAALTTGTLTFINLLLAVYLLVVGIFIFRQSFKARWMAWIYIVLKLPVTLGCGFAAIWMWRSLIQSSAAAPYNIAQTFEVMRNVFATPPFVGAIFPPIFALMLLMPSVRKYYSGKVVV